MANLEDLIDPEYGLQQDEWSLARPRFGAEGQLEVIGWSGKTGSNKLYVTVCHNCKKDPEMYGEGVFTSGKSNLLFSKMPCGCGKSPRRTKEQWETLAKRQCKQSGYEFMGFVEDEYQSKSKIKLKCKEHGEVWDTTPIGAFLSTGKGCPVCKTVAISKAHVGHTRNKVVKDTETLQQDEFSLSGRVFGDKGQLSLLGWKGKEVKSTGKLSKTYVVHCNICSNDEELFGGYEFSTSKGKLLRGDIPCGCGYHHRWTEDQYLVRCKRKAKEFGHEVVGLAGPYKGNKTKLHMRCPAHGDWHTTSIYNLLTGYSCRKCGEDRTALQKRVKTEETYSSFESEVVKSLSVVRRRSSNGKNLAYLKCECKRCGEVFESYYLNVVTQGTGCPVCSHQSQEFAYINLIKDENVVIGLKFGITKEKDAVRRLTSQNKKSVFNLENIGIWSFENYKICKAAELECKQTLECGVISKEFMPDGWTETVSVEDLDKIISIYEKHGGKRIK